MTRRISTEIDPPDVTIEPDTVCYIIVKARGYDVKDVRTVSDPGSNATDDHMYSVLEDNTDDPVEQELRAVINELNVDERADLVAMVWLGRGDGGIEEWETLREEAARVRSKRTAGYLLGIPLLADYLEEAMASFGWSCSDIERDHL
jgi:Protein of unknown function (DUF3775).